MRVFRDYVDELRLFIEARASSGYCRQFSVDSDVYWPCGKRENLVFAQDTAVELGHPLSESTAFILPSDDTTQISDGRITIIGPDLHKAISKKLPFAKIVLIGMQDSDEDTFYERYSELDMVRYQTALQGYMLRGTSQSMKEWSRVSKHAIEQGFSLQTLGSVLAGKYKEKTYVDAVELLFVTSSSEDIRVLQPLGEKVTKVIGAMNKMLRELSFDCDTCEYFDVCKEVMELRSMRNKQVQQHG